MEDFNGLDNRVSGLGGPPSSKPVRSLTAQCMLDALETHWESIAKSPLDDNQPWRFHQIGREFWNGEFKKECCEFFSNLREEKIESRWSYVLKSIRRQPFFIHIVWYYLVKVDSRSSECKRRETAFLICNELQKTATMSLNKALSDPDVEIPNISLISLFVSIQREAIYYDYIVTFCQGEVRRMKSIKWKADMNDSEEKYFESFSLNGEEYSGSNKVDDDMQSTWHMEGNVNNKTRRAMSKPGSTSLVRTHKSHVRESSGLFAQRSTPSHEEARYNHPAKQIQGESDSGVFKVYDRSKVQDELLQQQFKSFKATYKKDTAIRNIIMHAYKDESSGFIMVSVRERNADELRQHLDDKKYAEYRIQLIKQTNGTSECLTSEKTAAGKDSVSEDIKFETGIGPGSPIVKDRFLKIMRKHQKQVSQSQVYKLIDIFQVACAEAEPRNADGIEECVGWGSLGCFAVFESDKKFKDIFYLTSQHNIEKWNLPDDSPEDMFEKETEVPMISGFEQEHQISVLKNTLCDGGQEARIPVHDTVYISQASRGCFGLMDFEDQPTFVDVAFVGPLTKSVLELHQEFNPTEENHLVVPAEVSEELVGRKVKKLGATTNYTEGIIIEADYTVDVNLSKNRKMFGFETFLVTKAKGDIPAPEGGFAEKGDSGSIVLLQNDDLTQENGAVKQPTKTNKAVGIIYGIEKRLEFKYSSDPCPRTYHNVIICVRLDRCIEALKDMLKWKESIRLYYYQLEPILYLGHQTLPGDEEEIVELFHGT